MLRVEEDRVNVGQPLEVADVLVPGSGTKVRVCLCDGVIRVAPIRHAVEAACCTSAREEGISRGLASSCRVPTEHVADGVERRHQTSALQLLEHGLELHRLLCRRKWISGRALANEGQQ